MSVAPQSGALPMPNVGDYRDALQHPAQVFTDPNLKQGIAVCDAWGLPRAASGNYASVFYFTTPEGYRYAVRCFRKHVDDRQSRYGAIGEGMSEVRSSWKVPFRYFPDEVTVGGRSHPIMCMEWVQGVGLDRFVEEHLDDPAQVRATADAFLRLAVDLRSRGIAHGDLQHGNILVTPKGLRLIDYDGMYVPALAGHEAVELGHRNYQHPQRKGRPEFFGPSLDDFSVWVIYLSLVAVAAEPALWSSLGGGDECLLLREEDLRNPGESNALRLLSASPALEVQYLLSHFLTVVRSPLEQVPALSAWHRTTRGTEVWKMPPRRPVATRVTGEPWWREALRQGEQGRETAAAQPSSPTPPPPSVQTRLPMPHPTPSPLSHSTPSPAAPPAPVPTPPPVPVRPQALATESPPPMPQERSASTRNHLLELAAPLTAVVGIALAVIVLLLAL